MSTAAAALVSVPPSASNSNALTAYEPKDLNQAYQLAKHFAASGLLGKLQTAEQVMLIMATGAELGIPATTALRAIHIIEGKPVVSADLKVALCTRHRDRCEYFRLVDSTEQSATYETKPVNGQPVRQTFTMEDAKQAQLNFKDGSNWRKYPRVMLRHRAAAELATAVYPDLVLGIYAEEEIDANEASAIPSSSAPSSLVMDGEFTEVSKPVAQAPAKETKPAATVESFEARFSAAMTKDELNVIGRELNGLGFSKPERDHLATLYSLAAKRVHALHVARQQGDAPASTPTPTPTRCSACDRTQGHADGCPNEPSNDQVQGRGQEG